MVLSVLGLACLAGCPQGMRAPRLLAALAAAATLSALLPARGSGAGDAEPPLLPSKPSGERLLVVGLDGADWSYIEPLIARRFALADARLAHELLGKGGVTGKIVLVGSVPSPPAAN